MGRQQTLPLDGPQFHDSLWSRVPEEDRRKVVEIVARLLVQVIHPEAGKENNNDDAND
jgi:hypothetical protein